MNPTILKNQAHLTSEVLRLSNKTSLVLSLAGLIQEQARLLEQFSRHTSGMLEEIKAYDTTITNAGPVSPEAPGSGPV